MFFIFFSGKIIFTYRQTKILLEGPVYQGFFSQNRIKDLLMQHIKYGIHKLKTDGCA